MRVHVVLEVGREQDQRARNRRKAHLLPDTVEARGTFLGPLHRWDLHIVNASPAWLRAESFGVTEAKRPRA